MKKLAMLLLLAALLAGCGRMKTEMAVTYEQIRSFMQGYFIGYSEDCQLPDRQRVMDKPFAMISVPCGTGDMPSA